MTQPKAVQEVDIIDVIRSVGRKSKKHQAKVLQEIEKHLDKGTLEFEEFRKFFLDEQNNFTRSVMRDIFGDIEYMIKG
jgi:hypothetical protein